MGKDTTTFGIIILALVGVWLIASGKLGELGIPPIGGLPLGVPQPTGQSKTTINETPSVPLDVWQSLTQEQLQGLPVTEQTGVVGFSKYYKTSEPIAIGDTGFKLWGLTESGAIVLSKNPPETYDRDEWIEM